jgi:ribosomal subunit interface protein
MKINTKATQISLSPDIKDYLDKKLEMVSRFVNDMEAFCEVEIGRTTKHHAGGDIFRAEINLTIKGKDFRAVSEKESLHAAIDEVKDEILSEIKHFKTKKTALVRRGGAAVKAMLKGIVPPYKNPFRKSR